MCHTRYAIGPIASKPHSKAPAISCLPCSPECVTKKSITQDGSHAHAYKTPRMVDVAAAKRANDATWQNRLSRFVIKEFFWDRVSQPKETPVKLSERPFKRIDDIHKKIDSKISLGIYGDIVSWERRRAGPGLPRPPKLMDPRLSFMTTLDSVLKSSISSEPMSFARNGMLLDDEDEAFGREVAAVEFYESVLLSHNEDFNLQYEIQKNFSYVKYCNVSGTIIALIQLNSLIQFNGETVFGIEKSDGVNTLLNLLSSEVTSIQRAALGILKKLCSLLFFGKMVVGLGGLETLSKLVLNGIEGVNFMTVELLASLSYLRETRVIAFRNNLIKNVICLLGKLLTESRFYESGKRRTELRSFSTSVKESIIGATLCALHTLGRMGSFRPNIELMREAGLIPLLIEFLSSTQNEIVDATYQVLTVCMHDEAVRKSSLSLNLVKNFLEASKSADTAVRISSAFAMAVCLVEPDAREEFNKVGGYVVYFRTAQQEVAVLRAALESSWLDEQEPLGDGDRATSIWHALKSHKTTHRSTSISSFYSIKRQPMPRMMQATDVPAQHLNLLRSQLDVLAAFMEEPVYTEILAAIGFKGVLTDLLTIFTPPIMTHIPPGYSLSPKMTKLEKLEKTTISILRCLTKINASLSPKSQPSADVSEHLVGLLSLWRSSILEPSIETVISLTANKAALKHLLGRHVFRIIFSLAFHKEAATQALALHAASKIIHEAPNKTAILRPISCSLEKLCVLIFSIIKRIDAGCKPRERTNLESILEWAFAFIAELGCLTFYRTLMIDLGVTKLLFSYLCEAKSTDCKRTLTQALQYTASGAMGNETIIGERQLTTLFTFLQPLCEALQRAAARVISALWLLPETGKRLKQLGMSKMLIQMLGSGVRELQLPAAVTICRMSLRFKDTDENQSPNQPNV